MSKPNDVVVRVAERDDLDGLLDLYAHMNPNDAPLPPVEDIQLAMELLAICVQLVSIDGLLSE